VYDDMMKLLLDVPPPSIREERANRKKEERKN
jgi:hypothetical protein